jgi:hypothetical protein
VVEYTTHIEAHDTMAGSAIDIRYRMADRRTDCVNTMARIAGYTWPHHQGTGVIGIGAEKTCSAMTVAAFGVGIRMRGRGRLAP